MKRILTWPLIWRLQLVSLAGLLTCRAVEILFFPGKEHLDQTFLGMWTLRVLAIIFGGTTMILVPLRIFWDRPQNRKIREYLIKSEFDSNTLPPVQRFIFDSNYARLPKWLYMPFVILALVLAGVFVLGILVIILLGVLKVILYSYSHLFGS